MSDMTTELSIKLLELGRSIGAHMMKFEYSGGGDEGTIDSWSFIDKTGQKLNCDKNIEKQIVDTVNELLYEIYYGFNNEPYVNGCLYVNMETNSVDLEATETCSEVLHVTLNEI